MTTKELKTSLHESIESTDDSELLLTIKEILEYKPGEQSEPKLSEWQKKRIEEADKEIDRGEFLTDEEAQKMIDEWLKR